MGRDDDCRWFVVGGRSRANKHNDTTSSWGWHVGRQHGSSHQPQGRKEVLQLPGDWPSQAPLSVMGGRRIEPGQRGGEGSLRLLVKCQHRGINQQRGQQEASAAKEVPQVGPSRGGGQRGSQAASNPGATANEGRKRVRDPTKSSALTPPNKQATRSTRFSYAAAVEGGKRVVLVSLDGTALTKEDPKLLQDAVNKLNLDALAKKEYHSIPEVLDAKLGLEVKTRDSKSVHLIGVCTAKANLRALTAEELEVLERPLRRHSGFMR